jgi:hypothetical protein
MYPECFVVITGWKSYQSPVIGSINDSLISVIKASYYALKHVSSIKVTLNSCLNPESNLIDLLIL